VVESLQSAFGIFMTGDVEAAKKLLREKTELRRAELEAADRHFERLREGRPESLETTSLHLDILSDLKRIHSHICSVAYPVLDAAGELSTYRSGDAEPAKLPPASAAQPLPR
jgi:phosphate:Na+ symporter